MGAPAQGFPPLLKVLLCVYARHDWSLVLLAAAVCVVAAITTFKVFGMAMATTGQVRRRWMAVTGFVAGAGIWATHFVAMLAYEPHLVTGYEPVLTIASLVIAVAMSVAGFSLAATAPGLRGR